MSSTALSLPSAVAEALARRRLGSGEGTRGAFTVAHTRAILQLRSLPQPSPWHWTILLVRAANALSDDAQGIVDEEEHGEERITRLVFTVPGASFAGLDLRDLLAGALAPDLGPPFHEVEPSERRLTRFRALVARASNLALAAELDELAVLSPAGSRVFSPAGAADPERDPFGARPGSERSPEGSFAVRLRGRRPGLSRRLGAWLLGRGELAAHLTELWRAAIVGADVEHDAGGGMSLRAAWPGPPVELGHHARFWRLPAAGCSWLVRDGVRVCALDPALAGTGLVTRELRGYVECPRLRLTADERGVARDAAFELLVAWLHDLTAHTFPPADAQREAPRVEWPTTLSAAPTVSGYTIGLETLQRRVQRRDEVLYVWNHQAASVPASARARVLKLWPSELRLLERALPEARLVPLRALGREPDLDGVDLAALEQGSLEPVGLVADAAGPGEGEPLRLDVVAFVHRLSPAVGGAVVLLAYEREVAHFRDPRWTIPGLTLVARLRAADGEIDLDGLRASPARIDAIAGFCRELAQSHLERLLSHALRRAGPWENPLARTALERLGAARIRVRYDLSGETLRLVWDDTVLLDFPVARDRAGRPRTLREALERCRDVGFLVEARPGGRWSTLESEDARLSPWIVDEHARALFDRVIAPSAVLRMPVVPEAYPAPRPVAQQRHLLLSRTEVERDLARGSVDPLARLRLLGHLLVARAVGADEMGLSGVPLLLRYDPRAASPARLVSVRAVLDDPPPPGLSFPGAVSRDLEGPVLEVPPGVAQLLFEVVGLSPRAAPRPERSLVGGEIPGPIRKRAREATALVIHPVVHPLAVGSLRIAADGTSSGVALWLRGLHVGEIRLPEPLGRVSGRLWLTGRARRDELEGAVGELAREVLEELVRQRGLLSAAGSQRAKLDAVIEYARATIGPADPLQLGPLLGLRSVARATEAALDRSLRAWPLQPLSRRPSRWLAEILTQALGFRLWLDSALLSWKAARVVGVRADGSIELELGRRNDWIQRALEAEQSGDLRAPFEAAAVVLGEFFRQLRAGGTLSPTPADEAVAHFRLLALLVGNVT